MFDKDYILEEIKRIAKERGGSPPGSQRFYTETGIKQHECERYWARWGDALKEAGFPPNRFQGAYDTDYLLERLAGLTRELGHFPTTREIKLKRRNDDSFPTANVFQRHGSMNTLEAKLLEYCKARPGYEDVVELCTPHSVQKARGTEASASEQVVGSVYLLKSGKYYKIGRTNAVGRREYDLAIKLPEKPRLVHSIKTDDPVGIEQYWHKRFEDRRKGGEWFDLNAKDISAFKRRKFM